MSREEERELEAQKMLARRLLTINPACNHEIGCPAQLVAFPVIREFMHSFSGWDGKRGDSPFLSSLLQTDGQGRWCEIDEIQEKAQRFLDAQ